MITSKMQYELSQRYAKHRDARELVEEAGIPRRYHAEWVGAFDWFNWAAVMMSPVQEKRLLEIVSEEHPQMGSTFTNV